MKDLVLRKAGEANMDNKLAPRWVDPYQVREVVGRGAYHLDVGFNSAKVQEGGELTF